MTDRERLVYLKTYKDPIISTDYDTRAAMNVTDDGRASSFAHDQFRDLLMWMASCPITRDIPEQVYRMHKRWGYAQDVIIDRCLTCIVVTLIEEWGYEPEQLHQEWLTTVVTCGRAVWPVPFHEAEDEDKAGIRRYHDSAHQSYKITMWWCKTRGLRPDSDMLRSGHNECNYWLLGYQFWWLQQEGRKINESQRKSEES